MDFGKTKHMVLQISLLLLYNLLERQVVFFLDLVVTLWKQMLLLLGSLLVLCHGYPLPQV